MADHRDVDRAREFAAWAAPHVPAIGAVAAREVGSNDSADIVQHTLLRAWRRWDTYRPDLGTPRTWLIAIAFGEIRRHRRSRIVRMHDRDLPELPTGEVRDATARLDVEAAVRRLPRRQREVVALFYLADLGVDEVAAVLGINSGSVKSYLSKARAALSELLEVSDDRDAR